MFYFSKDDIVFLHQEMIEEFLGLAAGEIDYPSFLSWVKFRI